MLNLKELKDEFDSIFHSVTSNNELQELKVKFLGKKGKITSIIKSIKELPEKDKAIYGKQVNEFKTTIEDLLKKKTEYIKHIEIEQQLRREQIDITIPGKKIEAGALHPITTVLREITEIFLSLGFSIEEGPEIETDYYNFEALNISKDHPARDMHDTFYITDDIILRTHTSPVQIRTMEKRLPPLSIIAPGKVYRCDCDISHTPMFHQVEGLMIDKDISFSHLKGILKLFIYEFFGKGIEIRFRPSYFPFTEPSAEVDIQCVICLGKGCRVCSGTGWLEVLGAGMVDPAVFSSVRYDPEAWTGFAFGLGVERFAMLKYGIDDIRLFFENDIRFLRQF